MKKKNFILGAMAGVAMGAAAGILLAPKSGKEMRGDIKNVFVDVKNDVMDEVKKMGTITRAKYKKVVSAILSGYQEAKKITPEQSKEIAEILDDSFSRIEEAANREMK